MTDTYTPIDYEKAGKLIRKETIAAGFEVKNIKSFNTHDGYAFDLTLYKNGKRVGSVQNQGCGGPNSYYDVPTEIEDELAAIGKKHGFEYDAADVAIDELYAMVQVQKEWQRISRTKTILVLKGEDPEQEYHTFSIPYCDRVKNTILRDYADQSPRVYDRVAKKFKAVR